MHKLKQGGNLDRIESLSVCDALCTQSSLPLASNARPQPHRNETVNFGRPCKQRRRRFGPRRATTVYRICRPDQVFDKIILARLAKFGRRISLLLRRGRKPKTELENFRITIQVACDHTACSGATRYQLNPSQLLTDGCRPQVGQIDLGWVPLLTILLPPDGSNESGSVDAT